MKYLIKYQEDFKIKEKIVDSLDEKELPLNIISIKKKSYSYILKKTISNSDIKQLLYELNLMLESKILLDEAVKIILDKEKNENKKYFLNVIKTSFTSSKDIDIQLKVFKINPLVKSFFKITQQSGNPALIIKYLYNLINEEYEIKKNFIKVLSYPILLLISFFLVLISIYQFVIPNFQSIFFNSNVEISLATKILFASKDIFENYFIYFVLLIFLLFGVISILYKKMESIKYKIDELVVTKFSIFSKIYLLKNLYQYFLMVHILLKCNYELLDSISKAKILLNNKYLFDRISKIENLLKSGKSVNFAFKQTLLFDEIVLSLISIAEVSNSLPKVIYEIKNIYKKRFDDKLRFFSLLIEPLFFIVIMLLIIWIIMAIFVPLWSISDMLRV